MSVGAWLTVLCSDVYAWDFYKKKCIFLSLSARQSTEMPLQDDYRNIVYQTKAALNSTLMNCTGLV